MTKEIVDNTKVTGTLNVTGAVDLDTTLNVDGAATLVAGATAAVMRTNSVSIADDAVHSFTPAVTAGHVFVTVTTSNQGSGCSYFRVNSASQTLLFYGGSNFAVTTGALTGTTGTDGKLTVSANNATGLVHIENRLGATVTVTYLIVG